MLFFIFKLSYHSFKFGSQIRRLSSTNIRLNFGIISANFRRRLKTSSRFVHSVSLNPKFAPKTFFMIDLTFMFLRGFVMVPPNCWFVLSICLDTKFATKTSFIIYKKKKNNFIIYYFGKLLFYLFATHVFQLFQHDPSQQLIYLAGLFVIQIFLQNRQHSLFENHVFQLFPCDPN